MLKIYENEWKNLYLKQVTKSKNITIIKGENKKMTEKKYKCKTCGKTIKTSEENDPQCCGEPMKQVPLDVCTQPHEAEYSGPFEEDEPCDDGR